MLQIPILSKYVTPVWCWPLFPHRASTDPPTKHARQPADPPDCYCEQKLYHMMLYRLKPTSRVRAKKSRPRHRTRPCTTSGARKVWVPVGGIYSPWNKSRRAYTNYPPMNSRWLFSRCGIFTPHGIRSDTPRRTIASRSRGLNSLYAVVKCPIHDPLQRSGTMLGGPVQISESQTTPQMGSAVSAERKHTPVPRVI